ncbi:MAG: hypothetical protein JWL92_562 [Candidatus Nomurabacteria bacterium]|nr:hypothetical protein [Candidatus Nomurabacteria bacterium]
MKRSLLYELPTATFNKWAKLQGIVKTKQIPTITKHIQGKDIQCPYVALNSENPERKIGVVLVDARRTESQRVSILIFQYFESLLERGVVDNDPFAIIEARWHSGDATTASLYADARMTSSAGRIRITDEDDFQANKVFMEVSSMMSNLFFDPEYEWVTEYDSKGNALCIRYEKIKEPAEA